MNKITVITPTWNQAEFIRDTIESVINQTHREIEYFIIDKCSDDGTQEIVEEYCAKDPRIIYIREPDHGQAHAINKGLSKASGDIVCWLNSDDYYYDDHVLERVAEKFDKNPDVGALVGDGWYCDKEKELTEYNASDRHVGAWVIQRWYYIMQPSVFWRNHHKPLDEKYHYVFDWKFFIEMFAEEKVYYTHEAYAVYRMYGDNKTGQDNAGRKKEIYLLQKEIDVSRCNTLWCRHVYKVYLQAEKTGRLSAKKRVDFISRVLFHLSGRRICSF